MYWKRMTNKLQSARYTIGRIQRVITVFALKDEADKIKRGEGRKLRGAVPTTERKSHQKFPGPPRAAREWRDQSNVVAF